MQKREGLLPSVPGYVAGVLVVCSFLLGHFSQQAHDVQLHGGHHAHAPAQV